MATETQDFYFEGKVSWLTNFKSEQYGNYHFLFYPKDADTRKAVKATGIRNGVKEDDGAKSGVEGFFYTFRSQDPFTIVNPDGSAVEKKIANGTEVKLKLKVEKFDTRSFGKVTRGSVDSIVVTKLIEYVAPVKEEEKKETVVPA